MSDLEIKEMESIFRAANATLTGPSPYLKTRVLARLREGRSHAPLFRWKFLSALGGAFSVALVALFFFQSRPEFSARTLEPVLVKVELKNIRESEVAFAEIVLPDGVHFYSTQFPEMNERRTLTLDWDPGFSAGSLPFVIRSDLKGDTEVKVFLKNRNNDVMEEKRIRIQFRG